MEETYYVIYTTCEHYNQQCPAYVMINKGYMIQSNLYDASKYNNKENAEKEMEKIASKFKNYKFEIVPVDKRIFGSNPRWIED